jgi:hypothetical protein
MKVPHDTFENTTVQTKFATVAARANATALETQTLAMVAANDAPGVLAQGFDRLNGGTLGAEQANIAFRDSETSVASSVKTNGRALGDNTSACRANLSAVLSSIQAAQAHAQAVGKQSGSVRKATATFHADIDALRSHLIALG